MRPRFHFTAPSGWINDPHGITYRDGRYHLFYQHVPDSLEWAPGCHWGHAVSDDLFSFETLPIALAPGDGDDGIWTGCVVEDTIFYTSVSQPDLGVGRVRMATPADARWIGWRKGEVVASAPADVVAYRDPFVFRDGSQWRMWVGAALKDDRAAVLSYVSEDLRAWAYDGIAASRSRHDHDPIWTGALWECPQLLEIDGRHVLITSVWSEDALHYVAYAIGALRDGKFHAETWGRLTYGDSHYAPSYFRDATGRACLLFWLRNIADPSEGWTGAHSIPYTLQLEDDRLVAVPHPDLAMHRRPVSDRQLPGTAADLSWTGTTLTISSANQVLAEVTATTDLTLRVGESSWTMPHKPGPVHVILDGPILELITLQGLLAAPITPPTTNLTITTDGALNHVATLHH
ncbi:hypothetical protein GCM10009804_46580 [Kribbella hippodromi]|uniref:beta-fructofuranosidase n=1 Tax=Kribbella hippodromi TaxID=434347 RepID=A0ABP4PM98_9ACTN